MEKRKSLKIYTTAIIISVFLGIIIITLGFVISNKKENPVSWVLHSYGNNVALYNGDDIVEVYGSIVLDTLPEEDRRQLDNGIVFSTREEAVKAIEDYDG